MEKHINKWLEKGYIDQKQASIILSDIKEEKKKTSEKAINITLYTIGAILLGIGVICFIAANDWILRLFYSRFAKISAAFFVTLLCFWLGYYFSYKKEGFKRLGGVLMFLSCLLIGGCWALIGQIYNLHTDLNWIILLIWLISIMPVAFLYKLKSVNIFSIILIVCTYLSYPDMWSRLQTLTPVALGLILYNFSNLPFMKKNFTDFAPPYKTVSTVILFLTTIAIWCAGYNAFNENLAGTAFCTVLLIFTLVNYLMSNKNNIITIESIILVLVCALGMLLSIKMPEIAGIILNIIISNTILILMIYFMYDFGYKLQDTRLAGRANIFLLIYIAVLYFKIGYQYLDKALFFLLGGAILLGTGIYLEKQKRNRIKKNEQ